jgi:hypothetical protein
MLRRIWPLLLAVLLPSACSRSGQMPSQQADGSYRLTCTGPLTDCLERAERICKDEGYTVMGHDVHELLGHESGQSQVEVRKSEATIFCGKPQGAGSRTFVELKRDPVTASPAPAKAAPLACVPGSTQACIGPGGCKGGQACASDGSRYESCDCSSQPSSAPPESP